MELFGINEKEHEIYKWKFPHRMSVFSLNIYEQKILEEFIGKHKTTRDWDPNKVSPIERDQKWKNLQETTRILIPLINDFLIQTGFESGTNYGMKTENADNFSAILEENKIYETEDSFLSLHPEFSFEYGKVLSSLECKAYLNYHYKYPGQKEDFSIILEGFKELHTKKPDGINHPIVEDGLGEVVAVTHVPIVIKELKKIYETIGYERLQELKELKRVVYNEGRMRNEKDIVMEILINGYSQKLIEFLDPPLNNQDQDNFIKEKGLKTTIH